MSVNLYKLREHPAVDYGSALSATKKSRTILGVEATASIDKPMEEVSKDTSEMRIEQTVTGFFVDCTISYQTKLQLKRAPTTAQGSSASNKGKSPSKHNHARHMQPVASVETTVSPTKMAKHVENNGLTPKTDRYLRTVCKVPTPTRAAIARSPQKVREILNKVFKKPVNILANTHYGDQKNLTVSGLASTNELETIGERMTRPLIDRLFEELHTTDIQPAKLTLKFVKEFTEILKKLKDRADPLEIQLNRFFDLEEAIFKMQSANIPDTKLFATALSELLDLKTNICRDFSACSQISAIKNRRTDWYWVNRTVKICDLPNFIPVNLKVLDPTDSELVKLKERALKASRFIALEANYQYEAALKIDELAIENIESIYFGDNPREKVLDLLTPKAKINSVILDLDD